VSILVGPPGYLGGLSEVRLLTFFCCLDRPLLRGELVEIVCGSFFLFKDRDFTFGEPRRTDMTDFYI
jgi:hypothetical protein